MRSIETTQVKTIIGSLLIMTLFVSMFSVVFVAPVVADNHEKEGTIEDGGENSKNAEQPPNKYNDGGLASEDDPVESDAFPPIDPERDYGDAAVGTVYNFENLRDDDKTTTARFETNKDSLAVGFATYNVPNTENYAIDINIQSQSTGKDDKASQILVTPVKITGQPIDNTYVLKEDSVTIGLSENESKHIRRAGEFYLVYTMCEAGGEEVEVGKSELISTDSKKDGDGYTVANDNSDIDTVTCGGAYYNSPPKSDAFATPLTIHIGPDETFETAFLDASNSKDADNNIASYDWSLIQGNSNHVKSIGTGVTDTVEFYEEGKYRFRVNVTDDSGLYDTAKTGVITVTEDSDGDGINDGKDGCDAKSEDYDGYQNSDGCYDADTPDANLVASPTKIHIFDTSASISLDASGSTDPGNNINRYKWRSSGPHSVSIANTGNQATATFTEEGTYKIGVKVIDESGEKDSTTVTVEVTEDTDNDGILDSNDACIFKPGDLDGYKDNGCPDNDAPNAVADSPNSVKLDGQAETIKLDASGSSDPANNIESYKWEKVSGGAVSGLGNGQVINVQVKDGSTYKFRVTVTDKNGDTDTATTTTKVNTDQNKRPSVNPTHNPSQPQISVAEYSESFKLISNANDPDKNIVTINWKLKNGPGNVDGLADKSVTTVTAYKEGQYTFEVEVIDAKGKRATGTVTVPVGVKSSPDKPNAVAQADISGNYISLDGSGSSSGVAITKYDWDILSTNRRYIEDFDGKGVSETVTYTKAERFTFRLTITDKQGRKATDTVSVNPAGSKRISCSATYTGDQTVVPGEKLSYEITCKNKGTEVTNVNMKVKGGGNSDTYQTNVDVNNKVTKEISIDAPSDRGSVTVTAHGENGYLKKTNVDIVNTCSQVEKAYQNNKISIVDYSRFMGNNGCKSQITVSVVDKKPENHFAVTGGFREKRTHAFVKRPWNDHDKLSAYDKEEYYWANFKISVPEKYVENREDVKIRYRVTNPRSADEGEKTFIPKRTYTTEWISVEAGNDKVIKHVARHKNLISDENWDAQMDIKWQVKTRGSSWRTIYVQPTVVEEEEEDPSGPKFSGGKRVCSGTCIEDPVVVPTNNYGKPTSNSAGSETTNSGGGGGTQGQFQQRSLSTKISG